jgi:hypothetical protein
MKSIEDRLRDAKNDIALIIAALSLDTDDLVVIDHREVEGAALSAAVRAHEELHWLQLVPAAILNTDSPTEDELTEANRKLAMLAPGDTLTPSERARKAVRR